MASLFRNDLYVNLYSSELSRLSKTADRNVEVVIEAVDETGAVLSEAVSPGASANLTSEFSTGKLQVVLTIYYYYYYYLNIIDFSFLHKVNSFSINC